MTYDQAAAKGHKIQGAIKCTYAEFTWKDNLDEKLFTIQRRSTSDKTKLKAGEKMLVQTGERSFQLVSAPEKGVGADFMGIELHDEEGNALNDQLNPINEDGNLIYDSQGNPIDYEGEYLLEFDHAIVQTDTKAGLQPVWHQTGKTTSRKFIPVKLLQEAKDLLRQKFCQERPEYFLLADYVKMEHRQWGKDYEIRYDVTPPELDPNAKETENHKYKRILYSGLTHPNEKTWDSLWACSDYWTIRVKSWWKKVQDYDGGAYGYTLDNIPADLYLYLYGDTRHMELFKYSLWNIGLYVLLKCYPVTFRGLIYVDLPNGIGHDYDGWNGSKYYTFWTLWMKNQYDALDWLLQDSRCGQYIDSHPDEIPYIYLNIHIPKRGKEALAQRMVMANERSARLDEMLKKDRWFYVKECAMDWQNTTSENETIPSGFGGGTVPTINPETGQPYTIEDYVDLCRQQVEKEKKILAAAGLSNIF